MIRDYKSDADKFYRIVAAAPGLSHTNILTKTQGWASDYRQQVINWAVTLDWVRVEDFKPARGKASKRYWPIKQTVTAESPLDAAVRELGEARGLAARFELLIESAAGRLAELQATA